MYQNLPNNCYYCGIELDKETLTKEHAPPKCFFPKAEKHSLITVPSCVKHNSGKSHDDEYLFQIVSIQISANEKGQDIAADKAVRSILRNRKLSKNLARNATQIYVDENSDGNLKPTLAFKFDEARIENSIESIAKALFFYEFHQNFAGKTTVYKESQISLDDKDSIKINKNLEKTRRNIRENFSKVERKGNNQSIFYYQVMSLPNNYNFSLAIRLCFYEGVGFVVLLKKHVSFKLNPIVASLSF